MKKVLVITLVLVMALASSAMAAVTVTGKFTATAQMNSLKVFVEEFTLTPVMTITLKGTNSNVVDEVTNWDFTGGVSLDSAFKLGQYKLGLYDDYFKAYVWGKGFQHTSKSSYFSMISSGAVASDIRARLEVPVLDLGTVTADFDPKDNVRAFVNGTVEGFDVGLAFARTDWTDEDKVANTIVGQVGTDIPAGDIGVRLQAAAGVNLGEDLGLGFGFSAASDVTEQLNLTGSVTHGNAKWAGDGTAVVADQTKLATKATFTESAFQVIADLGYTIVKDGTDTNSVKLTGKYRMSDAVTFGNLFETKGDAWAANTAPAFGAVVQLADMKFVDVTVNVTSPVLENMIWVKGQAVYKANKSYEASVLGHIVPFDKLTIQPLVKYAYSGTEGTPTVNLKANYKIGSSSTLLKFEGQRVFATAPTSLLKLSVEVPF